MVDIIIDLETLGTKPGCIILEVGACAIDPRTGEITANFSRRLDEVLTRFDEWVGDGDAQNTLIWWMRDVTASTYASIVRRGAGRYSGRSAAKALSAFCDWFSVQISGHAPETVRVWSNGPAFDVSILCAAFDRYDIKRPWICWQERCVRTALEQRGYKRGSVEWAENGPRHRALNDARHEARKLIACGALGEGK